MDINGKNGPDGTNRYERDKWTCTGRMDLTGQIDLNGTNGPKRHEWKGTGRMALTGQTGLYGTNGPGHIDLYATNGHVRDNGPERDKWA